MLPHFWFSTAFTRLLVAGFPTVPQDVSLAIVTTLRWLWLEAGSSCSGSLLPYPLNVALDAMIAALVLSSLSRLTALPALGAPDGIGTVTEETAFPCLFRDVLGI
jgi:hypothetical protein